MTDSDIIDIFSTKNGKINPNRTRLSWLEKHSDVKEYLENRYEKFFGYTEALKYIFNGDVKLHTCKTCGEFLKYPHQKYCSIKCELTNNEFIENRNNDIDWEARTGKFKKTCMDKYGVEVPAQNPAIRKKMSEHHDYKKSFETCRHTWLEKYGVENVFQLSEMQQKAKQTKLEHRPNDPCNHMKQKTTMIERYGIESALCNSEFRDKGKITKLKKYNDETFTNIDKGKKTKLIRYGDENYNNSQKHRETCIKKYGVDSYSKTSEFSKKRRGRYVYDNIYFDSSYELAFYLYQKYNDDIDIKRCDLCYSYYVNGVEHKYFPDFIIDGTLYEIKGKHFLQNETLINPFDSSQDNTYAAKYQCMLDNNVVIIDDCTEFVKWVRNIFGKQFLSQCRVK